MNVTRVVGRNFGPFPEFDLALPEGVLAITGGNGSGKSTILSAIEFGLYGDGARDLADKLGPFAERLELEVYFDHAGDEYRIRRTYVGGTRGKATLDFEVADSEVLGDSDAEPWATWRPITRETASATQDLLVCTVGMSRRLFNASAFLAQENSAAFTKASPADRKAMIGEALDHDELWPKRAEKARGDARAAEQVISADQARLGDREAVAETVQALKLDLGIWLGEQDSAATSLEHTEKASEDAQALLAQNAAAEERRKAAEQAHVAATREAFAAKHAYLEAKAEAEKLPEAKGRLSELEAEASRIPELEAELEAQRVAITAVDTARERKQAADARAAQLNATSRAAYAKGQEQLRVHQALLARLEHLQGEPSSEDRCALCEQLLGAEARAATIANLNEELRVLTVEVLAHAPEILRTEREAKKAGDEAGAISVPALPPQIDMSLLLSARQAVELRAALMVTLVAYEEQAAKLPSLLEAVGETEGYAGVQAATLARVAAEMQDDAVLQGAATSARAAVQARRTALDAANAAVVRAQEALSRAQEAQAEAKALRSALESQHAQLDTLRLAERAFGRDGIPALIAETIVPVIEAEANRILERLPTSSGTVLRVELRTQRALKGDASAIRETLDILVSDRQTTREFLTYSGGERFRVSFALRWALAKLLAGRRGAESRLLVIDEPDGLDAGGMDGLAGILREEAGSFNRILIVSHNPLLASAFEQVVELESDGVVSRMLAQIEAWPETSEPEVLA